MPWQTRLAHLNLAASRLSGLAARGEERQLLAEMRQLCRGLPAILQRPLPEAMAQLTLEEEVIRPLPDETTTRQLADLAALLERQSPLGLCLRRSLLRYHYLRQMGIPVVVKFGAKFGDGMPEKDVTGHAWLEVNGRVYYEPEENWRGFTVMFTWPPAV